MIYLTGSTNSAIESRLIAAGIGLMNGPACAYAPERVARYPWCAFDNGAFAQFGPNPKPWNEDVWMDWLMTQPRERCLFAVSPDVPDAVEALRRGLAYSDTIKEAGFPVAVVAQNGAERLNWEPHFGERIDCLFIGGTPRKRRADEWKVSPEAHGLMRRARDAGAWVHVGRCNSLSAVEQARRAGANSCDGNFIGIAPETNLARAGRWFDWLDMHAMLPVFQWETPALPVHKAAMG